MEIDLMAPRYKYTAPYPNSPFLIGDILTPIWSSYDWFTCNGRESLHITTLQDHPHLFECLPWWAEREVGEMPAYIKSKTQDFVCKPIYHEDVGLFYVDEDEADQYFTGDFLPSNFQEYTDYLNTQKI